MSRETWNDIEDKTTQSSANLKPMLAKSLNDKVCHGINNHPGIYESSYSTNT